MFHPPNITLDIVWLQPHPGYSLAAIFVRRTISWDMLGGGYGLPGICIGQRHANQGFLQMKSLPIRKPHPMCVPKPELT